jgi:hypothetical protein
MKTFNTKRLLLVALLTFAAAAITAGQASATTLTVCPSGCAFTQIAPALAAAKNGDTIQVAAGTYNGGFTIDKSVKLAGAGPSQTIISGGGPAITIGSFGATSEPTVSIDAVKITGGATHSSPESTLFAGKEGVIALGGGIEIPPNADFSGGATVAISNSVITDNRVAPSDTVGFGFAIAAGGGIDNWGTVSLASTTVSNNHADTTAGIAEGAGIHNELAGLTLSNISISGNQATASGPTGFIVDAGGICIGGLGFLGNLGFGGGTLTISNSSVTDNSATLTDVLPFGVVPSGGIHANGDAQAMTISNTTITGNTATMTNSVGDAFAFSGGLHNDIQNLNNVTLSNDVIDDNSVHSTTLTGSSGDAFGGSGAGEIGGTLSNVRLTGNTVNVSSVAANANAAGGATVFDGGTITNSLISDNHIHASSPLGSVMVRGGGIDVAVSLTLRNSTVRANTVNASGASGSAFGGGIFDVAFPDGPDGPPGGALVLQSSNVTGNTLSETAGILLQGGGIYLHDEPIKLTNSVIAQNIPDQCFGC